MNNSNITLQLEPADVKEFTADVLVLKYAQSNYGVDKFISTDLLNNGIKEKEINPEIGHTALINNVGTTNFKKILFIGVKPLYDFGYQDIKRFAAHSLNVLGNRAPVTEHIAMTIHGVGFGLDENEAFLSQVAGILESIQNSSYPKALKKISIIERNKERCNRLKKVLEHFLNEQSNVTQKESSKGFSVELNLTPTGKAKRFDNIIMAGTSSEIKKHIFVAMPFREDMNNTFYFGIQQPIHNNDFLCERIDQDNFIGDILIKIKQKIETASAVVADLTFQNPNVYLEIGYAWGHDIPTILIIEENDMPRFDLQGQQYIKYKKENLFDLQQKLSNHISVLVSEGEIK
jgi:hypothetical protein